MKYIAFLRGINVGNIRIKMTDLQDCFEATGCTSVKTYLQTGNVVFDSPLAQPELKTVLEQALTRRFQYEAFVLLYPFEVLQGFIQGYTMPRDEEHHAYVVFVETPATWDTLKPLAEAVHETAEQAQLGNQVIYWRVQRGDSTNTPFAKILAKAKFKSTTTVRNLNTLEKMG